MNGYSVLRNLTGGFENPLAQTYFSLDCLLLKYKQSHDFDNAFLLFAIVQPILLHDLCRVNKTKKLINRKKQPLFKQ